MSTVFARNRGREAPMQGLEFTNRANPVPAWRLGLGGSEQNENMNGQLKRTHSTANPPASPFDPKKLQAGIPRPVFGENIHYLFRPPETVATQSAWLTPAHETPEIDMRDVEITPPRPSHAPSSLSEYARGRNLGKDQDKDVRDASEDEDDENEENVSPERRLISNAALRRIARRRKQDGGSRRMKSRLRDLVRVGGHEEDEGSSDEEGYDGDGSPRKSRAVTQNTSNHYTLNMPGPAPARNETPYILLGYLQFCFNLSLILVFLYLLVQFIFTVQRDVQERIGEHSLEIIQEVQTCTQQFKQNLCDTTPIPAMLQQCATWEMCMNRDPRIVGRARVGAEMLAEVINGFVEPISWKTLLFTLSSLAFMTVFVNTLLSLYRSRHNPNRREDAPHPPVPMPVPHFPPFHHNAYGYLPAPPQTDANGRWLPHPHWHPEPQSEAEMVPRQRRRLENGTGADAEAKS